MISEDAEDLFAVTAEEVIIGFSLELQEAKEAYNSLLLTGKDNDAEIMDETLPNKLNSNSYFQPLTDSRGNVGIIDELHGDKSKSLSSSRKRGRPYKPKTSEHAHSIDVTTLLSNELYKNNRKTVSTVNSLQRSRYRKENESFADYIGHRQRGQNS